MSEPRSCVIAGGGPAGMIAGLLLARAGVDVVVLEKHEDFLRDFRGDTIHPSTLLLLDELGLMPRFQASVPHQRVQAARLPVADGGRVTMVDFSRLRHPYPYIAMAPQWDFLDLLAEAAAEESSFELRLGAEVTGLLWDGAAAEGSQHDDDGASSAAQVTGVTVRGPDGEEQIPALLTLAADGRTSRVREQAGLPAVTFPVPLDVWWFRLESSSRLGMAETVLPRFTGAYPILPIPRGDYVQAAMLIPKGADARLRARGIEVLREEVCAAVSECEEAAARLELEDVKLLDVRMDRLTRWWRRGMLCLGDAAHAMSPAGGVGVNLAVQDGVAAATLLAAPLRRGVITDADVAAVQRRRMPPTRLTQALQSQIHRQLEAMFSAGAPPEVPASVERLMRRVPQLSGLMPWVIGVGVRPEHAPAWARR
ncbi:FAD-dependent oxidoreductase [Nesterenkonia sp. CL21]|uniref:FAD-dependent oxidoreductase n=1 Tax=Nesterenkonia sp. CL21 TaxID=3064894 RepID=UPI00287AA84F|nr:FAD-dependent oxidoreductase [Nesterenkonia sp. CL21]MDS2173100.1 FAD-dependent oxidoreductase [Nesterenkonia sp. CL21]